MLLTLLALLAAPGAEAKTLTCDIIPNGGLYSGGKLVVEEAAEVSVRWLNPTGQEEKLMGGTKVCGLETSAMQYAPLCGTNFTRPTPLKKMVTLCRLPREAGQRWIASFSLALDPRDGSAQVRCQTSLGRYTDFDLRLKGCTED